MKTQLSNFEQAFSTGGGSCVDVCHCGHTFYDAVNSYSWAEGEKILNDAQTALSENAKNQAREPSAPNTTTAP